MTRNDFSSMPLLYRYRSTGQIADTGTYTANNGRRSSDGTAVLTARVFDHNWSGDTETKPCGSDVERIGMGGLQWTVTVPAVYSACAFQNLYVTGDGGGYLVQQSGDRSAFTVHRILPGGTLGWSAAQSLAGNGRIAGLDGTGGDELIFADGEGRIAYVTEHNYACTAGGSPATCKRVRLTVRDAGGSVVLTRDFQQAGYIAHTGNSFRGGRGLRADLPRRQLHTGGRPTRHRPGTFRDHQCHGAVRR